MENEVGDWRCTWCSLLQSHRTTALRPARIHIHLTFIIIILPLEFLLLAVSSSLFIWYAQLEWLYIYFQLVFAILRFLLETSNACLARAYLVCLYLTMSLLFPAFSYTACWQVATIHASISVYIVGNAWPDTLFWSWCSTNEQTNT